jgi:hypothetical protein
MMTQTALAAHPSRHERACHAWRSGTDPTLVINYLKAFSTLPSVAKADSRLHVCGEAYSDYQGFIEGALRSAAEVLTGPPFGISKDDLRVRDRRLGRTRRVPDVRRPK